MGDIKKITEAIGVRLSVPEEGPVISRDEVVTTTTSSMTVTTVTKTRAEVNDAATGKQITRDTTTTVEKVERNTTDGVFLMESKTSESWVKAEEGTLHYIETESTSHSRPGSAGTGSPPQHPGQVDGQVTEPGSLPSNSGQSDGASSVLEHSSASDTRKSVGTDEENPLADLDHVQQPPHCKPKPKSTSPDPPN